MCARFGCLSVLPWILFAQMSWDLSAVPVLHAATTSATYEVPPEINDRAAVFNYNAKRRARKSLRAIRYAHGVPILVETITSLEGERIEAEAQQRARPLGSDGIYILVAGSGKDQDVAVVLGRNHARGLLGEPDRAAIRAAFLEAIRAGDADGGLEAGVRAVGSTLAIAAATHAKPKSKIRDIMIPATIMATLVVVLFALQIGTHDENPRKRRPSWAATPGETVLHGVHNLRFHRAPGQH